MLIPTGYAQVNYFLPTVNWPNVPQVTCGVDVSSWIGTIDEAAEACYTAFAENILDLLTSNTTLSKVRIKYGPNATGPFVEFAGSAEGSSPDTTEPPAIAILVKKNTALGGRQGQGRMFLPGYATAGVDPAGGLATGVAASTTAAFEAWRADHETLLLPLVLLHGVGTSDTTPEPITSFAAQQQVGTQRRRNRG